MELTERKYFSNKNKQPGRGTFEHLLCVTSGLSTLLGSGEMESEIPAIKELVEAKQTQYTEGI